MLSYLICIYIIIIIAIIDNMIAYRSKQCISDIVSLNAYCISSIVMYHVCMYSNDMTRTFLLTLSFNNAPLNNPLPNKIVFFILE